jgi:RNA polymerase sigma-70 factor, ECF subfamily
MADTPSRQFKAELIAATKTARVYATSLTRNKDAADDLVQTSLIKALENHDRFEQGTNLSAWLNTIIKNTFYDEMKSHRISRTDQMDDETNYDMGDSGTSHVIDLEIEKINAYVNDTLEERDRSVFLMWVEGLKTDEIAAALDLTRSNVGVIVCRIRKDITVRFAG